MSLMDNFTIFSKGGMVLWSHSEAPLLGNPLNNLVKTVLLEERGGENSYNYEKYSMKWTFANEVGLIFVAVYQRIFQLLYIDRLLELVKDSFLNLFKGHLHSPIESKRSKVKYIEIIDRFQQEVKNKSANVPRPFEQTLRGRELIRITNKPSKKNKGFNKSEESNEKIEKTKEKDKSENFSLISQSNGHLQIEDEKENKNEK